jgi:PAS domain-containing protein
MRDEERTKSPSVHELSPLLRRSEESEDLETPRFNQGEVDENRSSDRALLQTLANGILMTDINGKTIGYNRRFLEIWKIPESFVDSRHGDFTLPLDVAQLKDPERFLKKIIECFAQPQDESYDVLEFKDGRKFEWASLPQTVGGKSVGRVWSLHAIG